MNQKKKPALPRLDIRELAKGANILRVDETHYGMSKPESQNPFDGMNESISIRSMTGFGRSHKVIGGVEIEVLVRSVNARFLDLKMHLPREFLPMETDLRNLVKSYGTRGTIDLFLHIKEGFESHFQFQPKLIKAYQKQIEVLRKEFGDSAISGVAGSLISSGLLLAKESLSDRKDLAKSVFALVQEALLRWQASRVEEGSKLQVVLLRDLELLKTEVREVEKIRSEAGKGIAGRLQERLKEKLADFENHSERVAAEITFWLERGDFTEEIDRFETHSKNFRKLLLGEELPGKKLDFYTQELLREINTIGSKAAIAEVTRHVVESKALIEKLREQVQNIE